jgi:hypothetical protein
VQRGFALLTTNAKDFVDVPGMKVVALPATLSGA